MGTNETVVEASRDEDRLEHEAPAKRDADQADPGSDQPTPPGQPGSPDGKYDG